MASSFGKYQGGIEASTTNLVQAYGNMGQQTAQAIAGFGQNLAQGLQQYNENSAKNDVLTAEAEQLGLQIQQFKDQFGDSPEHAPFAQSLQPYIEQLSKVPAMSLTQKMGAVTGVKAAFGNIGQQLQAFELMRGERLKRDYWAARNQTPTTNVVTDPVAIAKGEVPWDDTKTYDQNISNFRQIAERASDSGVAIDINKATQLYVANIEQSLKTGRDKSGKPIAPETLAALQDQIYKAQGYEENAMTGEDGVTDYSKEADLYESLSKSAKDMVKEKKAADSKGGTTPEADTLERWNKQKETAQKAIDALTGKTASDQAYQKAVTNYEGLVKQDRLLYQDRKSQWQRDQINLQKEFDQIPDKITALQDFQNSLPTKIKDKDGNEVMNPEWLKAEKSMLALRKRSDEIRRRGTNLSGEAGLLDIPEPENPFEADGTPKRPKPTREQYKVAGDTTPNAPENLAAYAGMAKEADQNISRLTKVQEQERTRVKAKAEIAKIDALIRQADKSAAEETDTPMGWMDKAAMAMESGVLDSINQKGFKEMARMYISQGRIKEVTPDTARMILDELNSDSMGGMAALGAIITPDPSAFGLGLVESTRQLSRAEERLLEGAFAEWRTQDRIKRAEKSGDATFLKEELIKRKQLLEGRVLTGLETPKSSDISKANAASAKKAEVEKPTLIGTSSNLVIGTKRREVKASVEQQESAMAGYFQKKYGYVPAGFSEMYKANTPEANFKTMETPYGAFMWDGKGWSQIKTGTPMSAKEAGENAAYQFSNPDGSPKEFANSGVYLSGTFQGTTTELAKFRTEYRSLAHAEKSIARLIEINEMTGESLSPTLKGEAKALLPAIKAALRTEIIGVGTVSNYEQELINDVVAGAADFWSLESSDRAKLAVIMDRVRNSINDVPAIYGLSVQRKGDSANIEKSLRQALLNSGGMSSREAKWRAANPDKQ